MFLAKYAALFFLCHALLNVCLSLYYVPKSLESEMATIERESYRIGSDVEKCTYDLMYLLEKSGVAPDRRSSSFSWPNGCSEEKYEKHKEKKEEQQKQDKTEKKEREAINNSVNKAAAKEPILSFEISNCPNHRESVYIAEKGKNY